MRDILGKETLVTLKEGSSVRDLIRRLEELYGASYRRPNGERLADSMTKQFRVTINGKILSPLDLDALLKGGDEIIFFQLTGS